MRTWFSAGFALVLCLSPLPADAAGKCGLDGEHGAAVAAARAAVRERCDCEAATSHAAYMQCARDVIRELSDGGDLPRMCRSRLRRYARRSTCGRDDVIVCCESRDAYHVRAAIRPESVGCRLRPNHGYCVGRFPHLEDACTSSGPVCSQSYCGDGILDVHSNEKCEPPGVGLCDPYCQLIVCGNGEIDPGEDCEPPGTATCDPNCRTKICGDGVVDPGTEDCEPPGTPACDDQCYPIDGCGNGLVEIVHGEECEPPGTATCDAECRFIHVCGNGVIEPGEECDGQPRCSASCTLLRTVCCDLAGICFGGSATNDFDAYFNFFKPCFQILGGTGSSGVCEGTPTCDPAFPSGLGCRVGSCVDQPIEPTALCCEDVDGTCRDTIATTTGAIGSFNCSTFPPPDQGDVPHLMLGSCGVDGRCVPAS